MNLFPVCSEPRPPRFISSPLNGLAMQLSGVVLESVGQDQIQWLSNSFRITFPSVFRHFIQPSGSLAFQTSFPGLNLHLFRVCRWSFNSSWPSSLVCPFVYALNTNPQDLNSSPRRSSELLLCE